MIKWMVRVSDNLQDIVSAHTRSSTRVQLRREQTLAAEGVASRLPDGQGHMPEFRHEFEYSDDSGDDEDRDHESMDTAVTRFLNAEEEDAVAAAHVTRPFSAEAQAFLDGSVSGMPLPPRSAAPARPGQAPATHRTMQKFHFLTNLCRA